MGYGRLGESESMRSTAPNPNPNPSLTKQRKKRNLILLSSLSIFLLIGCAISAVVLVRVRNGNSGSSDPLSFRKPTQAISKICSKTRYPDLCVNSLLDFPGSISAGERDLVHISVNMTLTHVGKALYDATSITNLEMDTRVRSAYDVCVELLEESVDQLSRSLVSVTASSDDNNGKVGSTDDVLTWLSAALTNHDTCTDGFTGVDSGYVKDQMSLRLRDLSELVSNCLAIFAASSGGDGGDFDGIPIQNRRRLMGSGLQERESGFPKWVGRKERRLLDLPLSAIQADIIVSKDGKNGTYKTISSAIKAAPEKSKRRTIIYVKAGKYEEKMIKVGKKKKSLMFIGDGMGKTVISGGKSVLGNNITTFHTASFAATGAGFIARDITFENWAGPDMHQAVALRVGADHAVVYRCSIEAYQDSLYVHSQRQFYRDCNIYGTVDFIFGNAAVVIQNSTIWARKPMDQQKITITAQSRKDPNQNTGISIHNCRLAVTDDFAKVKSNFSTYLGRPWKMYARTVYMLTYMGDHIHPNGWLEWNDTFALDTLYYGEYMNYGPGAGVGGRVKWSGYRVITSATEAAKFTVGKFIYGSSWLPSTGVAFLAGLSV